MEEGKIQHNFEIAAPPAKIYLALADGQHIKNWWTRNCTLEPRVGAKGMFLWDHHGWKVEMIVRRLEYAKAIEWECLSSNMQDTDAWAGTRLSFVIDPIAQEKSRLSFTQATYRTSPCRDVCTDGWRHVLGTSLKSYIETGVGLPY